MELNYKAIGTRIKNVRSKIGINQERLAELAGLSVTHTSHIETGNTKVSLPALVKIANALCVSLDELVCDSLLKSRAVFEDELSEILNDCMEHEIRIIVDMAKALKLSMRERLRGRI